MLDQLLQAVMDAAPPVGQPFPNPYRERWFELLEAAVKVRNPERAGSEGSS